MPSLLVRLDEKRTTVLRLRWLLTLALAYLLLFHTEQALTSGWILTIVVLYLGSNLVLMALPHRVFHHHWFDTGLILGDTVTVSAALTLANLPTQNLYLFFFLIILLNTLGKGLKRIVANGLIIIGVYSFFLFQFYGSQVISQSGMLLQIPFLLICTIFYGVLMDQEHQRRQQVLEQLQSASEAIVVHLNLQKVLNRILEAVTELLGAETVSIMLLDRDGRDLVLAQGRGIQPELIGTVRQRADEGFAGWIVQHGEPLLLQDLTADPWLAGPNTHRQPVVSAMGVPLRTRDKIIGMLNASRLTRRQRFTRQDLKLLTLFSSSISTAIEHARLFEELKEAHFEAILAFGEALETRDLYTGGHIHRVLNYATALARKLGLPQDEIETLQYVAMLHDIGKIGIPDHILHSTEPLNEENWRLMKGHSAKGASMLSRIPALARFAPYVHHHHERWDGKGYPDGLKGENIPLYSRIIAVADTYDGLTTDRPYKKAIGQDEAVRVLESSAGSQLDPHLVKVFLQALSEMPSLRRPVQTG